MEEFYLPLLKFPTILYTRLLRRAHPNDGTVQSGRNIRGADSQIAREQMLAQFVLAKPAFYPSCARRTHFLPALPHYYNIVRGYGGFAPMFTNSP